MYCKHALLREPKYSNSGSSARRCVCFNCTKSKAVLFTGIFFLPLGEAEIAFGFASVLANQVPNRNGTGLAPPGLDELRPLTAAFSFIKGREFQKIFTHFHLNQSQLMGYSLCCRNHWLKPGGPCCLGCYYIYIIYVGYIKLDTLNCLGQLKLCGCR